MPTEHETRVAAMGEEAARLVEMGWDAIVETGPVFVLRDGTRIPMRPFGDIRAPPGVEGNERYAWYVGRLLEERARAGRPLP